MPESKFGYVDLKIQSIQWKLCRFEADDFQLKSQISSFTSLSIKLDPLWNHFRKRHLDGIQA